MAIARHKVVYLDYVIRDESGQILEQTEEGEPFAYIHGLGQFGPPALEDKLNGMEEGEQRELTLSPEEGYGMPDPEAFFAVPRDIFPQDQTLEVGDILMGEDEDGEQWPLRVVELRDGEVRVDANHPFAGKTLRYSISIRGLRDATAEELSHQHLHEDGFQH